MLVLYSRNRRQCPAFFCHALRSIILLVASSMIILYRPLVPSVPLKPHSSNVLRHYGFAVDSRESGETVVLIGCRLVGFSPGLSYAQLPHCGSSLLVGGLPRGSALATLGGLTRSSALYGALCYALTT